MTTEEFPTPEQVKINQFESKYKVQLKGARGLILYHLNKYDGGRINIGFVYAPPVRQKICEELSKAGWDMTQDPKDPEIWIIEPTLKDWRKL